MHCAEYWKVLKTTLDWNVQNFKRRKFSCQMSLYPLTRKMSKTSKASSRVWLGTPHSCPNSGTPIIVIIHTHFPPPCPSLVPRPSHVFQFAWEKSARASQSGDVIRRGLRCSCVSMPTNPQSLACGEAMTMLIMWASGRRYPPVSHTASD